MGLGVLRAIDTSWYVKKRFEMKKKFSGSLAEVGQDEARWQEYRNKGINYIENTHREFLVSSALQKALNLATHN